MSNLDVTNMLERIMIVLHHNIQGLVLHHNTIPASLHFDTPNALVPFERDHATPTVLRMSSSRSEISPPRKRSASELHIHSRVCATHSGGM